MDFKKEIANLIAINLDFLDEQLISASLEVPSNSKMGNYSLPCFKFAKRIKKAPNNIALDICNSIKKPGWIEEIKVEGSYINFFIKSSFYAEVVVKEILQNEKKYGQMGIGKGKTIVIDYSSPNIAKPFHVGHLRSTSIGNALYNIHKFLGYDCVGINYIGDWGTQFGKLIVAYKLWGNEDLIVEKGISELTRIYVKFHDEADKNPSLNDDARAWLIKMQEGDGEALKLWTRFKDISILEFNKIYEMLGIEFDSWNGESFYTDKMDDVVEELREKK